MANWFIALPVEPGSWFARVSAPPAGTRLFHPDDLHITVAFLGEVNEELARRAFTHASAWPSASVAARLGAVVPMGRASHPSAFSALLTHGEADAGAGIAAVRDLMADAAQVPRESRAVVPHVTVARPKRSADAAQRRQAAAWAKSLALGNPAVQLSAIALYTWAEPRAERLFRVVDTYNLRLR
jgi:2'-5' RNA ligase